MILLSCVLSGYLVALAAALAWLLFRRSGLLLIAEAAGLATFAVHSVMIALRWIASGHPPAMGGFENSIAGAWFVVLLYFAFRVKFKGLRLAAALVFLFSSLLLVNALSSTAELSAFKPPYRSGWLYFHVVSAWCGFGALLLSAITSAIYLGRSAREEDAAQLSLIDETGLKLVVFGFVSLSIMLATGALWAHDLWGRYWGWDPVELWSLICWVTYGIILHLRLTLGWRGRRAAILCLASILTVILAFFGIGVLNSIHTELL